MGSPRGDAEEAVRGLLQADHVTGAALVTRDGLPAITEFDRAMDAQTLAAMGAAALAAAETAILDLDPTGLTHMVLYANNTRAALVGIDDRHLLLLVIDSAATGSELESIIDEAKERLQPVLAT